ncbi:phage tail assembly chaperone [Hyphomicrobium sp.]|uniref:phage tail assembly chaperone n=1 Tax=Hyphomicrobium sp. TaxID=82 RepID=UPI000FA30498|nr:phage tail assembly chaperone [Hyphomicrobium sp.]RUP11111.1 MAG: phage tail assembly chaperone [Hyphomicrobium sp.]
MELGLGVLGMVPAVFWSLTPRELQAALAGKFGDAGGNRELTRLDLDALMQRFPDERPINADE